MHINKQISGLQHPPKTTLSYGKSMNNERRGVNCVHTWFLKQEEIKSQLSQWVSLFKDSPGNGKAPFFLPTEKLFLFTLFQKASSPPNGTTLLFFLSSSEKISFSLKKYLFLRKNIFFLEKQISFSEKHISSSFSYLFSLFFVHPTIFAATTFSSPICPLLTACGTPF